MYYDKKLQSLAWKGVERENGSPKVWKSHGWVSTIHRFTSDTIEEDYFLRSFKYSFVLFCSSCAQCHCVGQCSCCSPWEAKRGSRPQSGQHFEVLVLLVVSWFLLPWSNNIWIILWIYIYIVYEYITSEVWDLRPSASCRMSKVIECLRPRIYGSGDFVIHEGDEGREIFLGFESQKIYENMINMDVDFVWFGGRSWVLPLDWRRSFCHQGLNSILRVVPSI